jgi:hypothetical protein
MTDQDFETMLFNESSKTATLFVARAAAAHAGRVQ